MSIARYEIEIDGTTIVDVGLPELEDGRRKFNAGGFTEETEHSFRGRTISGAGVASAWIDLGTTTTLAAFDPYESAKLWSALEADTLAYADNTVVTNGAEWTDSSGNSNDATFVLVSSGMKLQHNELNGHKALEFLGSTASYVQFPAMSGLTAGEIFLVMKATALNAGNGLLDMGVTGVGADFYPLATSDIYSEFGTTTGKSPLTSNITILNTWHVLNIYSDAGDWGLYQDDVEVHQTDTNTVAFADFPKLGVNGTGTPYPGLIAAVFIFDDKLSDFEREGMRAWLAANDYM